MVQIDVKSGHFIDLTSIGKPPKILHSCWPPEARGKEGLRWQCNGCGIVWTSVNWRFCFREPRRFEARGQYLGNYWRRETKFEGFRRKRQEKKDGAGFGL